MLALLARDCHVIALVRKRTGLFERLAASVASGSLEIREADLHQPGAFDQAFADCDAVIHCAAEVSTNARPDSEIWRRTLAVNIQGTENILSSIEKSSRVRALVFTSSMAAILSGRNLPGHHYSESDWNNQPLKESDPYWYSKTAAESLLFKAFQLPAHAGRRLVCFNPSIIVGPVHDARHGTGSIRILKDLHSGKTRACPDLHFHFVDVRDVAELHAHAALDEAIQGRFIVPGTPCSMQELSCAIRKHFPESKAPHTSVPDWLMYLSTPFNRQVSWRYLKQSLGVRHQFDDSRVTSTFRIPFRPLEQSIQDTIISLGHHPR
ncbi:NAD-dependent epimerase/dehydratase family protein [Chromobacterium sp. IIBBL 290-4]|nr:NAD-dependent epimerase/dehydratase family protein [Chromobacterium sp. IIBBL 290-4]UTH76440.1 NAD-dependent epimerase/dehydratase family protein [Chromobacterium sp. IIBBL 290-4]